MMNLQSIKDLKRFAGAFLIFLIIFNFIILVLTIINTLDFLINSPEIFADVYETGANHEKEPKVVRDKHSLIR